MVHLAHQLFAIQSIEVQAREVWSEDAQQLFLLTGFEPVVQPEGLVGRCGVELEQADGAELVAVAFRAHIAQLQVGLFIEQDRPACALLG